MLRTGIPASYWDTAPGAEVRTVLAMLEQQSEESSGPSAATSGGDVLVSGSQRRR